MIKRQHIPYLALLLAFSLWSLFKTETQKPQTPEHHPRSIAEQAISEHFDESGFNDYYIYAEKITNYPDAQLTLFEQPKVLVYSQNKQTGKITTWQLTSEKGTLKEQYTLILTDDVVVRNLTKDQIIQTMSTQSINMLLDTKELTTKQRVTWTGPQMQQQGTGMWASMTTEEMKLFSNITAVYLNEAN